MSFTYYGIINIIVVINSIIAIFNAHLPENPFQVNII